MTVKAPGKYCLIIKGIMSQQKLYLDLFMFIYVPLRSAPIQQVFDVLAQLLTKKVRI